MCPHPASAWIHDQHEGTVICGDCSRVIHEIDLSHGDLVPIPTTLTPNSLLDNACSNLHLPDSLRAESGRALSEIETDQRYAGFKRDELAAYALYETLHQHRVARTYKEIECVTGVSTKRLWDIESRGKVVVRNLSPIDFVDRFGSNLGLCFRARQQIKHYCSMLQELKNHAPQAIAASVIYYYCKQHQLDVGLHNVCEVSGVSTTCIRQLIKRRISYLVTQL